MLLFINAPTKRRSRTVRSSSRTAAAGSSIGSVANPRSRSGYLETVAARASFACLVSSFASDGSRPSAFGVGYEALLAPDHSPFDFSGVLLVDNDVKLYEVKEFAQLSGEDLRQILGLLAERKGFAKAKHCLISSTVCPLRNGCLHAHVGLGPQCDRLRSLTHETQRVGGLKPAKSRGSD